MKQGFCKPRPRAGNSHAGGDKNAPQTAVVVDTVEQYRCYDRLPANLRKLVQEAPVPLDVKQVLKTHINHKEGAEGFLSSALLAAYPGWVRR